MRRRIRDLIWILRSISQCERCRRYWLGLIVLFLCSITSAATRKVQYVDPAATGAGDGSSWTNAYTTASAWANQDTDLVSADQYLQTYFRSSGAHPDDTTGVTIDGWNTSATCTIEAIEDPNNYHNGVFNDSCYHLKVGAAVGITISDPYVTINGLQVTGIVTSWQCIYITNVASVVIKNCLLQDFTRTGSYAGIYFDTSTATGRAAFNNIIWNCSYGVYTNSANCSLAHNTIAACGVGMYVTRGGSTTIVVKNNLIQEGTGNCCTVGGSGGSLTTAYNWTSDATSPDGETYQNQSFTFVGGEDYHLAATEAGKYGCVTAGIETDIDGETRYAYYGGADELPVSGSGPAQTLDVGLNVGLNEGLQ